MAEKKFSELPSAASLTGNELAALSQMQSGSLASVKSTLQAIANWFAVYAQYTTALQTTDKSIAGAINELKQLISLIPQFSIEVVQTLPTEDISDTTIYLVPAEDPEVGNYYEEYIHVNNTWELVGTTAVDLSAYYTKLEVDGLLADKLEADDFEANQTASANPITLETKQAGLAKSCVVEMNPIQDLNGYSNPWAGGAGKNKLQNTATSATINGVIFTVNVDGTVTTNNTASAYTEFTVNSSFSLPSGTYILNGAPEYSGNTRRILLRKAGESSAIATDTGSGATFTLSEQTTLNLNITISSGQALSNYIFKPMIRLSTITDATFAPYSNICPISGRTEASVKRTGKNEIDEDFLLLATGWTKSGGEYSGLNNALHTAFSGGYSGDIKFRENTQYTVSFDFKANEDKITVFGFKYSDGTTSTSYLTNTTYERKNFTSTINKTVVGILFSYGGSTTVHFKEFQLEQGTTATAYEPYTAETKTKEFGQTVIGGRLDFENGGLDNEYELFEPTIVTTVAQSSGLWYWAFSLPKTSTNPLSTNGLMSSHFNPTNQVLAIGNCYITANGTLLLCVPSDQTLNTGALVNAWLAENNLQFAYKPATGTNIQLSPEAVTLLKGQNVISTDGDKVQVEFSDIPVGDYSTLLNYIKSLEDRIKALEG